MEGPQSKPWNESWNDARKKLEDWIFQSQGLPLSYCPILSQKVEINDCN